MKSIFFKCLLFILITSCKLQPDSNRAYDKLDKDRFYKLRLNPAAGSIYQYEISNKTEIGMEANGQEINTSNISDVVMNYQVARDSSGNFAFATTYDKIILHVNSNGNETVLNSDRANNSFDPVEKMLGILKAARLTATIDPQGEVKALTGFEELEQKVMKNFPESDHLGRNLAKTQWDKLVGEGMIRNTMDQLFGIFPDSAIHLGDTWKLDSEMGGELPLKVKATYRLKAINDDIAIIENRAMLTMDASSGMPGLAGATGNLKGDQAGEIAIETKTGMLISNELKSTLKGELQVMGRTIPVAIHSSVQMRGKKK